MIDQKILSRVQEKMDLVPLEEISFQHQSNLKTRDQSLEHILTEAALELSPPHQIRLQAEFKGLGPLEQLLQDPDVTEVIVNSYDNIWFERAGQLLPHLDQFNSDRTYINALHRVSEKSRSYLTVECPMAQGHFDGFRVQMVGGEITKTGPTLNLRRHPKNPWTLQSLQRREWAQEQEIALIQSWIRNRRNFLVVGPTGCGKTSVLNACLQELAIDERALILEDTQELNVPNKVSQRLLTREDTQKILPDITFSDLLRQALRLRPDRLVIGEIRGHEAKDLLLALSTGHAGSFGTLHASNPHQALIRLEMLIQLGAPNWSLPAIRKLIQLSLKGIIVVQKERDGKRKLEGCYEIASLEESGFLIQKIN